VSNSNTNRFCAYASKIEGLAQRAGFDSVWVNIEALVMKVTKNILGTARPIPHHLSTLTPTLRSQPRPLYNQSDRVSAVRSG
jgi:hypothetical protein